MKFKNRILQALIIIFASLFFTNTYASDLVGKTPGEFKVSSGAATYNIPIVVPPGIAGMQPNLSINYNSNSGNSLLGMGFNLSGVTAITRCGQTFAQDNKKTGVNYTSTDRFMIGGSRLIAVSGEYGAEDTEYRTEIDQYSKIVSYGTAPGGGPLYFKVWTKQGMVLELGFTENSRIQAAGRAADKEVVRIWNLNKISNKFGTSVNYIYNEDNTTGEHSLSKIEYGNNSVELTYEDRNDKKKFYQAGSKISITKRLKGIQTKADSILVRDYKLNYTEQAYIKTSILSSVQEFDGLGDSLPEIKFEWNEGSENSFNNYSSWNLKNAGIKPRGYIKCTDDKGVQAYLKDMNGDGLPDRVGYYNYNKKEYGFWVALNTGTDFDPYVSWDEKKDVGLKPEGYIIGSDEKGVYEDLIDMDGDGLPDRVSNYNYKRKEDGFWVALNTGKGFEPYKSWNIDNVGIQSKGYITSSDTNGIYADLIDMNGDGLPDRVDYQKHTTGVYDFWVAINNGEKFKEYESWNKNKDVGIQLKGYIAASNASGVYADLKDMNGDGLPDRVDYYNHKTGQFGFWVGLNNGNGFEKYKSWNLNNVGIHPRGYLICTNASGTYADLRDMNGDGLLDRVDYYNHKTGQFGFWVGLNNGSGFEQYESWNLNNVGIHPRGYLTCTNASGTYADLRDMNGDGLPDRVDYYNHKTPIWFFCRT
ncbi:MAG: hypothetical protein GY714_29290 [Desulfobacterales bacterium]|nr:hypothetical protein [Desulfobacterales bacterium]